MNASKIGTRIAAMRKERGYTQESFAELLNVSPQAVSKWENGHALPETALLPLLAKKLETSIDSLFLDNTIQILQAFFGDGMESHNVTARLNRLIENDVLEIDVNAVSLACVISNKGFSAENPFVFSALEHVRASGELRAASRDSRSVRQ